MREILECTPCLALVGGLKPRQKSKSHSAWLTKGLDKQQTSCCGTRTGYRNPGAGHAGVSGIFGRVLEVAHWLATVFHVVVLVSSVFGEHGTKYKAYLP